MRITELTETTTLADDDYLVIASEGGGACKILAKPLLPPESQNSDETEE